MVKDFRFQEQDTNSTSQSQQALRSLWHGLTREQGLPVWALLAIFLVMLLVWNWQLIAATSAGIMAMTAIYVMQDWNWNAILWKIHKFFQSPYRYLPLSVASGTVTVFLTYTLLALWSSQDNHWLASASILQLGATLTVLVLLIRQSFSQWLQRQQNNFDQLITQLAVNDDLARLIAIKQITQYVQTNRLPAVQEKAIADYCNLLLNRETEITTREALFETLEALQPNVLKPSLRRSANSADIT
ncbi:hypothetical protein H6F42_15180 [Pseudanabaena sp. FACHB-1998]|uniref:hypothetical protein n=1 Tax=Pseudanabaena sp. FACHB-1998 TaxID=2692858 RepID=UPI0016813B18|nr:hypothetical protein [Pseudanabaena sp. FACHB-1998]MBD2178259.1 hypothetical protein [Pseudanabaena sp. FACHB-1998]